MKSIAQPAFDLTSAHSLSLTSGVSGVLPLANGGTNKSLTADAGGIFYSDGDSFEILADGASGSFLTSGGTGAPTWTATTSIVVATSTLSLDSQLLDSIDSASFLRSDTDDTFTGALTLAGNLIQSSGTTTLLHTTIDGTSTTTGAALFQAGINQTGGTTTLQATNIEGAFVVGNGLTVGSGSVSLPAGSLATTTLSNAIISIGGVNFPLGHTDATPAFDLSDAVSLNATQLTSGTVPAARITGTGALDAGSITANFGAIDNGTSNITTGGILKLDVDGTCRERSRVSYSWSWK